MQYWLSDYEADLCHLRSSVSSGWKAVASMLPCCTATITLKLCSCCVPLVPSSRRGFLLLVAVTSPFSELSSLSRSCTTSSIAEACGGDCIVAKTRTDEPTWDADHRKGGFNGRNKFTDYLQNCRSSNKYSCAWIGCFNLSGWCITLKVGA